MGPASPAGVDVTPGTRTGVAGPRGYRRASLRAIMGESDRAKVAFDAAGALHNGAEQGMY